MEEGLFRKHRRFKRYKVEVQMAVVHEGCMRFDTAIELSEGGLLLKSLKRYRTGDSIEVCFFLADGGFISAAAEIAYVVEPRAGDRHAGVRFVSLTPESAARIRHDLGSR